MGPNLRPHLRLKLRPAPKAGTTVTTVIPTDTTDGEDTTEDTTDILTDTGGREKLRTNNLAPPPLLQLTLKPKPAPNLGIMVTTAIPTDTTVMEATMEVITDIPTDTGGREVLKTLILLLLLNCKVSKSVRLKLAPNPGIMVTTAIPTDTMDGEVTTEDTMDIPTDTGGNKSKLQLVRCDLDNCHPTTIY